MDASENKLSAAMLSYRDPAQEVGMMRFFKCGKGQYGEGDVFLGVKVPVTRAVVKTFWKDMSMLELEECMASRYHEIRLAALLALVEKFRKAPKTGKSRSEYVRFYLDHMDGINNWDLVDLSCYPLLGEWLLDKDREILYDLAKNGKTIWEQRIGIVSTLQLIRAGQPDDTYAIADIFLGKEEPLHDLLQKAVGWMLREAGKRDEDRLKAWLEPRVSRMPRTMLRYSIEKFEEGERKRFLHAR